MECFGMVYCEPCEKNNQTKPADIWCNECDEGYCNDCVKVHSVAKLLRDHHLISIEDYAKTKEISVDLICQDHKKENAFFCCQHDQILCLKCVQLKHNDCEVLELKDAAKGTKTSTAFSELEDLINGLLQNVRINIGVCKKYANDLLEHDQKIRNEITSMRNTLNEHLDKLQETLLSDLDFYCVNKKVQIEDCQNDLIEEENNFKQLQDKMSMMKQLASDTQTFIGIKQMDKTVYTHKISIKDKIETIPPCKCELEISPKLQSFVKDVLSFGEIISKTGSPTSFIEPKEKQAQLFCTKQVESSLKRPKPSLKLTGVYLKLRQSMLIKKRYTELNLTSCVILSNKKFMFADSDSNRLIIHNEAGAFEYFIKLNLPPFDIAVLDENTVVVTYRCQKERIDAVDIHSYMISEFASDSDDESHRRWGISCDNKMIYVVSYPNGIELLETSKKTVRTIKGINVHNVFNITVHQNKVYYTNTKSDSLFCADTCGSILWNVCDERLSCEAHSSGSLTSDTHGNIYLAGLSENIVMRVSNDGRSHRIVLDKSDRLSKPRGIFFDKDTNRLLVCNQKDGYAALYDVFDNN